MARLWTCGFEYGGSGTGDGPEGEVLERWTPNGATPGAGAARTGVGGIALDSPGPTVWKSNIGSSYFATGRRFYTRFYCRWPSADSGVGGGDIWELSRFAGASPIPPLAWISFGTRGFTPDNLKLSVGTIAPGANSYLHGSLLNYDQWYCFEVMWMIDAVGTAGEFAMRLDGTQLVSWTGITSFGTTAPDQAALFGDLASSTHAKFQYDDVAFNDDQGASQNSWPGPGEVRILVPTSDSARTGWTDAQLGTTNLWDAVDNIPPHGTADFTSSIPTVRAVGTAVTTGSMTTPATLSPTIPAGTVDGDLMLMFCYFDTGATVSGTTISTPTGWTDLALPIGAQADSQLGKVFYKQKVSGDTTPSVTFTGATTGNSGGTAIACIVSVQNAATTSPVGISGAATTGASDTTTLAMGAGSFTLPAGQILFAWGGKRDDGAANVLSGDGLTWTERLDSASTGGADAMMLIDTAAAPGANTAITAKTATLGTAAATAQTSTGRMFSITGPSGAGAKSHIRDANSNTTDTYDASMQSYTTAGLGGSDTVEVVEMIIGFGNSTSTVRNIGQTVVSNPAIAEVVTGSSGFPTQYQNGYAVGRSVGYPGSITLGTQPVTRVRKATASTDTLLVESMVLIVDSVPGVPPRPKAPQVDLQAVMRAATW